MMGVLATKLAHRPDAERIRLRLGTAFIEHADDLWLEGGAPSSDWIRAHAFDILALLEQAMRHNGHDARRLPRRLHWWLWLRADLEEGGVGV